MIIKRLKHFSDNPEQKLDEIKVAEGKMTKKEYANKWYKNNDNKKK